MKIKECEIHGIERIEGKRKSDGQPYGFWKLHLLVPFVSGKGEGMKAVTCTVSDDEKEEDGVKLGCTCTIVTAGYDRYEYVNVDGDTF